MVQNLASRNENWIQTWDTVMRWRHVSQKYYSKNMSLMLLRNIGLADVKLAKLHKLGAMAFKTPEGSCHLNYTYLHQRLLSIQAFIQPLFSTAIFSQRLISLMFAESVGPRGKFFEIWVSRLLENVLPTHFLTSNYTWIISDKHHFPSWILWFGDKVNKILSSKSMHTRPN